MATVVSPPPTSWAPPLMQAAADEARRARERDTLLLRASSIGDVASVERLLGEGASGTTACDQRRATALHLAAARGHADMVELLAAHGCDVDAEDEAGRTVLHVAALCAQADVVDVLTKRGAWLEATDKDDATALCHAAAGHHGGAAVRALLAAGASHTACDKRGLTPLAHAVVNDETEATEALLSAGADASVSVPDGRGNRWSLLHLACAVGALHTPRVLLSKACCSHTDASNALRLTPLHAAAGGAHVAVVKLLLGWRTGGKADVNALTYEGATPLDMLLDVQMPPGGDAALARDVAACADALKAAGGRRSSSTHSAPPPPPSDGAASADDATPTQRLARRFAAMPAARQLEQLERWVAVFSSSADAASTDAAATVALSVPTEAALKHIQAAGELRLHADLGDVILRFLEDEDWQELMRQPAVRAAVEAVQADPKNVTRWQEQSECMQALEQLRRLQHFCKPRALKTSLASLLLSADNTPQAVRQQCAARRQAARNAVDAARANILQAATGDSSPTPTTAAVPMAPSPTPPPPEQPVAPPVALPADEAPAVPSVSLKQRLWREVQSVALRSLVSALVAWLVVRAMSRLGGFGGDVDTTMTRAPFADEEL